MTEELIKILTNYGVLGIVAIFFFKNYFYMQEMNKEDRDERQKRMLELQIVLQKNTDVIEKTQSVLSNTQKMHDDLAVNVDSVMNKIDALSVKLDDLLKATSKSQQYQGTIIKTVNRQVQLVESIIVTLKEKGFEVQTNPTNNSPFPY